MESIEAAVPLPEELILLEYQASANFDERMQLYFHRDHFRRYWGKKESWLKLDFEQGEPCIRARHFVGLMPFNLGPDNHLLMVAPKGCYLDEQLGLLRFLDLVALADGGESLKDIQGVSFKLGRNTFLAFLAAHYARLLHDLCRQDFRRYFYSREDELNGRIRGRIHVGAHLRNVLSGREHRVPCRWEEFTSDNWDNRILLGAVRRLERSAAFFAPEASRYVNAQFLGLEPWFSSVAEVPIGIAEFSKARLWRTSRYYHRALDWARLIIQGLTRPVAGGKASPLVIDANDAFQRFAKVVTRAAAKSIGDGSAEVSKEGFGFLKSHPNREPDFVIRRHESVFAVGDAKYKDILEQSLTVDQLGDLHNAIIPKISAADWNQLYVYMRLTKATHGFFVVPFWNRVASAAQMVTNFEFIVSPLDREVGKDVRLAVVGLNLIQPLQRVRAQAIKLISQWFSMSA